ncbi:MAG: hypothetical protein BXU00_00185 [Candidatus Nanoclepta minutus]|uniref:ORC1-type DNA replication protein n=1 Tax=Candidatus Nanoclepta minutus TaxID=1940235 RepID=A0A397WS84_9ARCH|nr:MAG: hypothetical protein BXU00_00185 [Candidatus Nanoclepta minutus]
MARSNIIDFLVGDIDFLKQKKSIIKNREVLSEDFVPERILFREEQLNITLTSIRRFLIFGEGLNILFFGNTGTGKTLLARYISKSIKKLNLKEKMNIKTSYVNCKGFFIKEADYYIIGKMYSDITGDRFRKGKKKYEMFESIINYMNSKDYKAIIFLDEFDSLFNKKNTEDLLYALIRDLDIEYSNRFSLVMITNSVSFFDELDSRIKSSFSSFVKVNFPSYKATDLSEILKERAYLALEEGSISESLINYISARVAKHHSGDARVAINVLKLSALIADSKGKNKIEKEDIDEAFENLDYDLLKFIVSSLNTTQKILSLALVEGSLRKKDEYISFEELYNMYVEISSRLSIAPLKRITVFRNMCNLEMIFGSFLEVRTVSEGRRGGYKKIYKLLIDEESMKKLYDLLRDKIFNA